MMKIKQFFKQRHFLFPEAEKYGIIKIIKSLNYKNASDLKKNRPDFFPLTARDY